MVITPNSKIILIKSPLKLDNYNQLTFGDATDQYNYFIALPHSEYDDCTYQRKDGVIRYHTHTELNDNLPTFEDLLEYNYCMYQNTSYDNKWFYAFITDVNYINDGVTEIKIETDVFQTWQFDITYMNSFIEREHVSDDTIGLHTIPEGLEFGEYIINSTDALTTTLDTGLYICMGVTWLPSNTPGFTNNRMYGKVYSGISYMLFQNTESAGKFVQAIDDLGRDSSTTINSVFIVPLSLLGLTYSQITWNIGSLGNQTNISFIIVPNMITTNVATNISISSPSSIDSYSPRNNKLFVYPYNVLSVTNNSGIEGEFRYEEFSNNTPTFDIIGTFTPSGSMMVIPKNYKKSSSTNSGYRYGIPVSKYPQGSWNTDNYTNWIVQNGVNILGHRIDAPTYKAIGGSLQAITGGLTRDYAGIGSGLGGMFNAVQEMYRASLTPNTINGQVNSGDITCAIGKMSPTYYKMTIKQEYARVIDDFFTMYGYKVNRLATPNIHKRSNWDYIKCIDVNLEGNIPEKDLDKIRNLFNNGCTFWHTTSNYLDYSQTNSIL